MAQSQVSIKMDKFGVQSKRIGAGCYSYIGRNFTQQYGSAECVTKWWEVEYWEDNTHPRVIEYFESMGNKFDSKLDVLAELVGLDMELEMEKDYKEANELKEAEKKRVQEAMDRVDYDLDKGEYKHTEDAFFKEASSHFLCIPLTKAQFEEKVIMGESIHKQFGFETWSASCIKDMIRHVAESLEKAYYVGSITGKKDVKLLTA